MPEMKGRSLEELDEIFNAGVSVRKFTSFQCTIKDEAAFDVRERTGVVIENEKGVNVGEEIEDVEMRGMAI